MKNNKEIYGVTSRLIKILESESSKAILSELRNSAGKSFDQAETIWPFMFSNLPESFLGKGKHVTYEENAIYNTLQIYAICMQGTSKKLTADEKDAGNIGKSLSFIRQDTRNSMDQRFNAMITSDTYDELIYHLRQMMKILKAKADKNIKIDFPKLSEDLYWYQMGKGKEICFDWAKSYYMDYNTEEENNNE
jgi:CRISPR system Cascade subunit CasB